MELHKKERKKVMNITVDKSIKQKISELAELLGTTKSHLINQILEDKLNGEKDLQKLLFNLRRDIK